MRRVLTLMLAVMLSLCLAACRQEDSGHFSLTVADHTSQEEQNGSAKKQDEIVENPNILVAYDPAQQLVKEAAGWIAQELSSDLIEIGNDNDLQADQYEFVLLGFSSQDDRVSAAVEDFLKRFDFGARTIYPFVLDESADSASVTSAASLYSAISQLEPGALMGDDALIFTADTSQEDITDWAGGLSLTSGEPVPQVGDGNTVATAAVTPNRQQVLYLWEEGNAPAQTEYTVNNGGYSDDPDFRPYLTSYPVPEGTEIRGAVLICPGGAFQFRSDQPEGVDVAEALSALGYQSFVVDYRLRPYTQQEGALDLARAVRFVRAHAEEYGIDPQDIAVMGFSAGGILSGEMLLNFDGNTLPTVLDPDYQPDELDQASADAAACGMIYSFYGRLSVGTTDVELLRAGNLPPTFYCYGTRDPFYNQFLANGDAAEQAGVEVERLQLDGFPHGFGASGDWIPAYDQWLSAVFAKN